MRRLLLVHANADDRELYAEYLAAHGFSVAEAATTDAALPMIQECEILVTGLLVPGSFDGIELIRRMRAHSPVRDKAVVVVTACDVEAVLESATSAGCDALLLKPCLPDKLLAEIYRVLEH